MGRTAGRDIEQTTVAHPLRAARFTGSAGQAAIQVQLNVGTRVLSLEQFVDHMDSSARTVPLVVEKAEGRTDEGALTALHAGTQQLLGFAPDIGIAEAFGQNGFHIRTPGQGVRIASVLT